MLPRARDAERSGRLASPRVPGPDSDRRGDPGRGQPVQGGFERNIEYLLEWFSVDELLLGFRLRDGVANLPQERDIYKLFGFWTGRNRERR